MKNLFLIVSVLSMVFLNGNAFAANNWFYLGGGFGRTFFEDDDRFIGEYLDDEDKGSQLYGGFRFNDYFSVEANYTDFGDFNTRNSNIEFDAFAINAVGHLPFHRIPLEFFGKAGLGVIEWDETSPSPSVDDSAGALSLGFGLAFTPIDFLTMRIGVDVYAFTLEEYVVSNNVVYKREYDQAVSLNYLAIQANF